MADSNHSSAHARAVSEIQGGLRQFSRGLRLLTRELLKEAETAMRGGNHTPSPGRRVHGQYIGLIRNMSPRDRARVRGIHARKGVEAAIKAALELRQPK